MKDKEMQIEEMANDIPTDIIRYDGKPKGQRLYIEQRLVIAKELIKQGYRKLPEDSVVLTREELNEIIKQTKETEKNYYKKVVIPQERKETAEKIFNSLLKEFDKRKSCGNADVVVYELAKQFGVEIKE